LVNNFCEFAVKEYNLEESPVRELVSDKRYSRGANKAIFERFMQEKYSPEEDSAEEDSPIDD